MIDFAIHFAFTCFGAAIMMCLWQVITAGDIATRILALDTMIINMIALLTLYSINHGTGIFFEVTMIMAMFSFISTVSYARFMLRGNIIE